jgi:hypothetical protein
MGGKCPLLLWLGMGIARPVSGSINSSISGSFPALPCTSSDPPSLAFEGKFLNQRVWSFGSLVVISTSMVIREENWERHGVDKGKRLSQSQRYFSLAKRNITVSNRDYGVDKFYCETTAKKSEVHFLY